MTRFFSNMILNLHEMKSSDFAAIDRSKESGNQ
jgi:hypothetical protein